MVVTTMVVFLAGCGSTPPSPAAQAKATSALLVSAKAAIAREPSAHLSVIVTSTSAKGVEKITEDSGRQDGMETIAVGAATAAIRVTPSYGFISGSASGLTSIFGLSAAEAKKVGKDWVSFKAGTTQYTDFKSGVTMSSVASVLPQASGTKMSDEQVNGKKVHLLSWTIAATSSTPKTSSTLTISAVGAALPIEEIAKDSTGADETLRLSNWGEKVEVTAPPASSTITYAQVTG